uniref:NF-kappa-B essential modulator-like n=1 Tax=Oncorhynchus gorbuscha TaxID=8017 RepID=UPI001EAF6F77|nr:NF-kappa-B essential modulator-like [Oncorhynchus gorbuscha]
MSSRRKLAQLQHAYTCLFKDYDSKLKTEGGDMVVRLEEAERALALKQDLIDKLKEEVEQHRGSLETVPVLTAQAEIYKADFLAEREAREKLNQRKEELQDQLNTALAEMERLKQEGTSRARMEKMQQRHLEVFRPPRPHITPNQGVPLTPPPAAWDCLQREWLEAGLKSFLTTAVQSASTKPPTWTHCRYMSWTVSSNTHTLRQMFGGG